MTYSLWQSVAMTNSFVYIQYVIVDCVVVTIVQVEVNIPQATDVSKCSSTKAQRCIETGNSGMMMRGLQGHGVLT